MARRGLGQLDLFATGHVPANERPWGADIEALARGLDPLVHLGTSSWTFPGWGGLCYPRGVNEERLKREGLRLYSDFPLFRTVGIDRSYYAPVPRDELAAWASQLAPDFVCVEKVWDRLVTPVLARSAGALELNAHFLDPALFRSAIWEAHAGVFEQHVACFVLEFPPMRAAARPEATTFAERLARFLGGAPRGVRFAVELRNPELLSDAYVRTLRDHNATHVYSMWERMPMPGEQLARVPPTADFVVSRLLLRPGTRYQERKDAFAPFDRVVDPNEAMRSEIEQLARQATIDRRRTFVVVNNKAEGSAPLTVVELAKRLQRA